MCLFVRYERDGEAGCDEVGNIPKHWCGTPACVLGNFAARRDLQRLFTIDLDAASDFYVACNGEPFYFHDAEKACDYFGLDSNDDELDKLFGSNGCGNAQTPQEAIDFIEEVIARKKAGRSFPPSKPTELVYQRIDPNIIKRSTLTPYPTFGHKNITLC